MKWVWLSTIGMALLAVEHIYSAISLVVTAGKSIWGVPFIPAWMILLYSHGPRPETREIAMMWMPVLVILGAWMRHLAERLWKRDKDMWHVSVLVAGLSTLATLPFLFSLSKNLSYTITRFQNMPLHQSLRDVAYFGFLIVPSWFALVALLCAWPICFKEGLDEDNEELNLDANSSEDTK